MSAPWMAAAGLFAGFIDSIVGGGGLIALPTLILELGLTPAAVGTNKIVGSTATLVAVAVYARAKAMPWKPALKFGAAVAAGSLLGAALSPSYVRPFYPVMLWLGTALCLGTLLLRRRILEAAHRRHRHGGSSIPPSGLAIAFAIGLYDGAWGPGGGTFMFLGLLYTSPLGLLGAMAAAKIANLMSASVSLATYLWQGHVVWKPGLIVAGGVAFGALTGASLALKHAERVLTPLLLAVTGLLLWKVAF